ncbi:unnamed protein product [Nesidiocoris tenuis]|uniref:Uncharacterized protein n=1 Tax=Nesidiocoris tenuis TaxID=355587 RepID=A0A6H5GUM9_9HEMI|nr:unnamed protein product [Nesidiocoris tenuis]CAB0007161.1 unnamed protein product [Nesidiocoris tenuis]
MSAFQRYNHFWIFLTYWRRNRQNQAIMRAVSDNQRLRKLTAVPSDSDYPPERSARRMGSEPAGVLRVWNPNLQ